MLKQSLVSLFAVLSIVGLGTVVNISPTHGQNQSAERVTICHVPPGNPTNFKSIEISAEAASHHLATHPDFYDLSGKWSGLFYELAVFPDPSPMNVNFQGFCSTPGAVIASVDYPPSCSGTWELESAIGNTFVVREEVPPGPCVSNCRFTLTFDPSTGKITLDGLPGCQPWADDMYGELTRQP